MCQIFFEAFITGTYVRFDPPEALKLLRDPLLPVCSRGLLLLREPVAIRARNHAAQGRQPATCFCRQFGRTIRTYS
jgi:hypothetical protein